MTLDVIPAGGHAFPQSGRSPYPDQQPGPTQWLLCEVERHHFALPLSSVIETMRMLPLSMITGAAPMVLGVAVVRGRPIPVIDTSFLFGGQSRHCRRLVTVRARDRAVGLAVDSIIGIRRFSSLAGDLPPLLRESEALTGLQMIDRDLYYLLDTGRAIPIEVLDLVDSMEDMPS